MLVCCFWLAAVHWYYLLHTYAMNYVIYIYALYADCVSRAATKYDRFVCAVNELCGSDDIGWNHVAYIIGC